MYFCVDCAFYKGTGQRCFRHPSIFREPLDKACEEFCMAGGGRVLGSANMLRLRAAEVENLTRFLQD